MFIAALRPFSTVRDGGRGRHSTAPFGGAWDLSLPQHHMQRCAFNELFPVTSALTKPRSDGTGNSLVTQQNVECSNNEASWASMASPEALRT